MPHICEDRTLRANEETMKRNTKAGHRYDLLGHSLGGAIGVEPFLSTLAADAVPYTHFRHAGVEFISQLPSRRSKVCDGAR